MRINSFTSLAMILMGPFFLSCKPEAITEGKTEPSCSQSLVADLTDFQRKMETLLSIELPKQKIEDGNPELLATALRYCDEFFTKHSQNAPCVTEHSSISLALNYLHSSCEEIRNGTTIKRLEVAFQSRLPDLSKSVLLNLKDKVTYSGLMGLMDSISFPLVGDPRILVNVNPRAETLSGNLLIAVEDRMGLWSLAVPIVSDTMPGANDYIFADADFVFRADSVSGLIGGGWNLFYLAREENDGVGSAISYRFAMNETNPNVKLLGSFEIR